MAELPSLSLVHVRQANEYNISFTWRTECYGRAEFCLCPIWKRGRVTQLYIVPKQQPDARFSYLLDDISSESLSISSPLVENLEQPRIRRLHWCREHRTAAVDVYAPDHSAVLEVGALPSCLDLWFRRAPHTASLGTKANT